MMIELDVGSPRTVLLRGRTAFAFAALMLALPCSTLRSEDVGPSKSESSKTSDADYARQRSEWKKLDDEVDSLVAARNYEHALDKARDLVKAAAKLNRPEDGRSLIAPGILRELERVCGLDTAARDRYTATRDRFMHGDVAKDDRRLVTAYRSLTSARRELVELVGPDSMSVWEAGYALGLVLYDLGYWIDRKYSDEGLQLAEQQSTIALKMFGKDDPQYGGALAAEAAFHRLLDDHVKALPLEKETIRIHQSFFGDNHLVTSLSIGAAGVSYAERGDVKTGEEMLRQGLRVITQAPMPDEGMVALARKRIARVALLAGRLDDAATEIDEALKQLPNSEPGNNQHLDLARVELLELRATVCERQGDKAGAKAATEEANKIRETVKAKISR